MQSWGYIAGIMGQLQWIQFRTISTISDTPLPLPYLIPSPVISIVTMAVTEVPGIYFTLRFPRRFTVPFSDLRFPSLIYGPLLRSTVLFSKTSNACITAVIAEVLA
jgi:hypothetical protein